MGDVGGLQHLQQQPSRKKRQPRVHRNGMGPMPPSAPMPFIKVHHGPQNTHMPAPGTLRLSSSGSFPGYSMPYNPPPFAPVMPHPGTLQQGCNCNSRCMPPHALDYLHHLTLRQFLAFYLCVCKALCFHWPRKGSHCGFLFKSVSV